VLKHAKRTFQKSIRTERTISSRTRSQYRGPKTLQTVKQTNAGKPWCTDQCIQVLDPHSKDKVPTTMVGKGGSFPEYCSKPGSIFKVGGEYLLLKGKIQRKKIKHSEEINGPTSRASRSCQARRDVIESQNLKGTIIRRTPATKQSRKKRAVHQPHKPFGNQHKREGGVNKTEKESEKKMVAR